MFTKALVAAKRQSKEDTTFKFFACQTSTIATISCYFETLVFGFFLVLAVYVWFFHEKIFASVYLKSPVSVGKIWVSIDSLSQ